MNKKTPSISEALAAIKSGLDKTAEEDLQELPPEVGEVLPEVLPEVEAPPNDIISADSEQGLETAAEDLVVAAQEKSDAADSLRSIAKTAADNSTLLMEKEAAQFGKTFATTFLQTVEEQAQESDQMNKVAEEAYEQTQAVLQDQANIDMVNSIIKEAADLTDSFLVSTMEKEAAVQQTLEDTALTDEDMAGIAKEAHEETTAFLASL